MVQTQQLQTLLNTYTYSTSVSVRTKILKVYTQLQWLTDIGQTADLFIFNCIINRETVFVHVHSMRGAGVEGCGLCEHKN